MHSDGWWERSYYRIPIGRGELLIHNSAYQGITSWHSNSIVQHEFLMPWRFTDTCEESWERLGAAWKILTNTNRSIQSTHTKSMR